ncbi:apolipoprotein A-Ia isoform X1 [Paramisgurnus dabryanus]|uniref:apolipoprotein A-Ia isoform X1 n=2 Tax=Paramisgurnus dabryanus TaxID=90735 RepID=UPI0031F43262
MALLDYQKIQMSNQKTVHTSACQHIDASCTLFGFYPVRSESLLHLPFEPLICTRTGFQFHTHGICPIKALYLCCSTSIIRSSTTQGLTMKFVALALTLLLALGSQASFWQADAPSQLEHYQSAALVYLTQVREQAQKALENLEGTDYEQYKVKVSESLAKLQEYAQSTSQSLTPYTETFSNQFLETTKQLRERVMTDIEELRTRLEPHRVELHAVLEKHMDEYRQKLEPVIQEYVALNRENSEKLRAKLQPMMDDLTQKIETNVEETKSKLMPMVEAVRTKLTERLEELRTMAAPYAEEYKEQLVKAVEEAKEKLNPHTQDLQTRAEPYVEEFKAKFAVWYETIAKAIQEQM